MRPDDVRWTVHENTPFPETAIPPGFQGMQKFLNGAEYYTTGNRGHNTYFGQNWGNDTDFARNMYYVSGFFAIIIPDIQKF